MPIQVVCSSFNQDILGLFCLFLGPVISFANILSYSFLRLPFCFVSGFLCCVKAFKLNWVPVVYVCLCFLCLRRQIQKIMPLLYWRVSCLCFLLVLRFLVLRLGFLIDFEFIFGGSVRKCFHFILPTVMVTNGIAHLVGNCTALPVWESGSIRSLSFPVPRWFSQGTCLVLQQLLKPSFTKMMSMKEI